MVFDITHIIASGAIILGALWVLEYTSVLDGASNGKRTLYRFLLLFVLLFILNIFMPYGR